MSMGLGPGTPGPVTMRAGEGPTSGLPTPPPRLRGPLRWFGLGLTTGIVGTLAAVLTVATLTQ